MNSNKELYKFLLIVAVIVFLVFTVQAKSGKQSVSNGSTTYKPLPMSPFTAAKSDSPPEWLRLLLKEKGFDLDEKTEKISPIVLPKSEFEKLSPPYWELVNSKGTLENLKNQSAWANWNRPQVRPCESNTTYGVSYGALNLAVTYWKDHVYISISVGVSVPKGAVSYARGFCEPSIGFFINSTLAMGSKGINSTWYPFDKQNKPTASNMTSSPSIGASAGRTFQIR